MLGGKIWMRFDKIFWIKIAKNRVFYTQAFGWAFRGPSARHVSISLEPGTVACVPVSLWSHRACSACLIVANSAFPCTGTFPSLQVYFCYLIYWLSLPDLLSLPHLLAVVTWFSYFRYLLYWFSLPGLLSLPHILTFITLIYFRYLVYWLSLPDLLTFITWFINCRYLVHLLLLPDGLLTSVTYFIKFFFI